MTDSATRKSSCPKGFFVNISIGGSKADSVNSAAAAMVNKGLFVAVAAGNSGTDAASTSPASEPSVCTIGAISTGPALASYSNYGSSVDLFAVGTNVKSTWINGGTVSHHALSGPSCTSPILTDTSLEHPLRHLYGHPSHHWACCLLRFQDWPPIWSLHSHEKCRHQRHHQGPPFRHHEQDRLQRQPRRQISLSTTLFSCEHIKALDKVH